ncbi:MAG: ABC transporter ATP-binding protein [Betaproteobacteria bacterium]|nr:ABC transporter ATP-binding protein [Betaproteobacteria bacterium]
MSNSRSLLSCRSFGLAIDGRALCVGLDFAVRAGECWVIVGPNGAGKTTLLRALAGLRRPEAGSVRYGDRDVAALTRREQAGLRCYLAETTTDYFPATALDIALSGRHPHLSRWQWEGADDVARARRALAAFGVETCAERDVATLSGGERRRVALAAMLAQDAPLLLLDEPSSHLDLGQQIAAFDVLTGHARARGAAIVMVVHDLHLALRYADHAIAIGGGSARAGAAAEALTAEALSTLFGRRLVAVGEGSARTLVPA